ncbi:MAG: hypothetical protein ACU84H_15340, partial [Gammaproteobacteria bacterium]
LKTLFYDKYNIFNKTASKITGVLILVDKGRCPLLLNGVLNGRFKRDCALSRSTLPAIKARHSHKKQEKNPA